MEINALGLYMKLTIFHNYVALHMSLLVPGVKDAEVYTQNKLAKSTIRTIGVTSKCSHKAASLDLDSQKPQLKVIFVAVTNANVSSAKDLAVGITNKLEIS